MSLIAFYPELRQLHIGLVLTSGGLFALRGLSLFAGTRLGMARPVRLASYAIDTALLAAGLTLWQLLQLHPWYDRWLGTKLVLLLAYIVLGSLALKRAPTRATRLAAFVLALGCYGFMLSVAVTHHPAGLFRSGPG